MKHVFTAIVVIAFLVFVYSGEPRVDWEEEYNDLLEQYEEDLDSAYERGYDRGHEDGYSEGYDDGLFEYSNECGAVNLDLIDNHIEDVDDSTAISGLGYCADNDAMFVEFKSNGYIYAYWDVPRPVYDGIWEAESKGGYFYEHIRDVYDYTRFK